MPEKVIIIGSGPAAWTAAIYAARAELQPLVFEGALSEENRLAGTLPLGQLNLTTEVENYPGFPAGDLEAYFQSACRRATADDGPAPEARRQRAGVDGADAAAGPQFRRAQRHGRHRRRGVGRPPLRAGRLRRQALRGLGGDRGHGGAGQLPGPALGRTFKNRGVSGCAVCDGALPRFRQRPLAVIGGGDSAVEEAEYLSKFASVIYLVHRRDQLRASKIMADRAKHNPKIQPVWNRTVEEVLGNDRDGVTGVRLKSTTGEAELTLEIAGFFLAIGHTPNTAFLRERSS